MLGRFGGYFGNKRLDCSLKSNLETAEVGREGKDMVGWVEDRGSLKKNLTHEFVRFRLFNEE